MCSLAAYGLIHCDFNEFNMLVDDDEKVRLLRGEGSFLFVLFFEATMWVVIVCSAAQISVFNRSNLGFPPQVILIDFPQMISTSPNPNLRMKTHRYLNPSATQTAPLILLRLLKSLSSTAQISVSLRR